VSPSSKRFLPLRFLHAGTLSQNTDLFEN
jgi:hypothetical protein